MFCQKPPVNITKQRQLEHVPSHGCFYGRAGCVSSLENAPSYACFLKLRFGVEHGNGGELGDSD